MGIAYDQKGNFDRSNAGRFPETPGLALSRRRVPGAAPAKSLIHEKLVCELFDDGWLVSRNVLLQQ